MVDFDSPLDQEFLDEFYQAQRETWGDDLTRPIQFIIGRLNADGSVSTVVTSGEFGRIWVRQPGEDSGDAVQAINTILQPHEISFNRPVMVKQERGEFLIVARAPESANYDAQIPASPQRAINRQQYRVAMIYPSQPDSSFFAYYAGAIFQLNNEAYRITDTPSSDFSGTVPGSNAISIKVEIDPTTATWHETTGGAFTGGIIDAFKDGDLDTARTEGRFLIGWIRLYDGQTAIELEDILLAEHMLDLIDDHGKLVNRDDGDQHANYVYLTPAASTRNIILPTANNTIVPLRVKKFAGAGGTESLIEFYDENDAITSIIKSTGNIDARNITLDYTRTPNSVDPIISSTYTWNPASSPGGGSHVIDDRFIDYATGNSSAGVLIGHQTGLDVTGNGVINLRVYQAYLGNDGAGTIPKAALYYGFAPWNDGGGAITELHGIFLEDINVGVNNYSIRLNAGNAFFNDGGDADSDFRWSSDTEPNMLFGDAGTEQIFIGGTTNGMKIDKGGQVTLLGDARVTKEIQIKVEGFTLGPTAPTPAIIGNFSVLQFSGVGTTDTVYTIFHVPDDWEIGTDITVHVHWSPVNANAGNVKWQLTWSAVASNVGELISGAGIATSVIDATNTTQDELLESDHMTMAGGSLTAEDCIGICLFRDPADGDDTYGSAASLVLMEFSYTADKLGEAI